jgi:hypothetical protein
MNVEIRSIRDPGDLANERLVLRVLKDCDIGRYLTFDTTYTQDGKVSNLVRHPYWFPDKEVNAGDLVVLYTKTGRRSQLSNDDGSSSHFFYRGLDRTIWNQSGDCAVVLEILNWTTKGYESRQQ